jgi:3-methylcrotonyl-CoA carboxylase beta subunit
MDDVTLGTACDPHSEEFAANFKAQQTLAAGLTELLLTARDGGPESSRLRHTERGKVSTRSRQPFP